MPVVLNLNLHDRVVSEVAAQLVSNPPVFFFPDVVVNTVLQGTPLTQAEALLGNAERMQIQGSPTGPLVTLAKRLSNYGSLLSQEIESELLRYSSGGTTFIDPFEQIQVGWRRRLLLDHRRFRDHLREACTGTRQAVWLPPPFGSASQACQDLVLEAGNACNARVAPCEWQPGAGLGVDDIVTTLCLHLQPTSNAPPPPGATTPTAYVNQLARFLIDAANNTRRDVVFVFINFCASHAPKECLDLVVALAGLICAGNYPTRLRIVLLGCELTSAQVPRTILGPIDPAGLRVEALAQLRNANVPAADADSVLDDVWSDPPDLERIHTHISSILESI
jgi:hypothetical protein